MIHELKTRPEFFNDVAEESKTFEIRKNDRPFKVGDFLALNEYENGEYTGRCMIVRITYILDSPEYCKTGYVTLGITGCGIMTKHEELFKNIDWSRWGIPIYGSNKISKSEMIERSENNV